MDRSNYCWNLSVKHWTAVTPESIRIRKFPSGCRPHICKWCIVDYACSSVVGNLFVHRGKCRKINIPMFKIKLKDAPTGCVFVFFILWIYSIATYFVNIYQLIICDWDPNQPWKNEIIHAIGLIPPCNLITVWF